VAELQTNIHRLQAENARLRGEIESAKKSTWAVEKIAREDLGMSKKGEVVYMLPSRPSSAH
jgi:cell division protein FtsB